MSGKSFWYPNDRAHIRVRITPTPSKGRPGFTLIWKDQNDKRQRIWRADYKVEAENICTKLKHGESLAATLTAAQAAEYHALMAKVHPRNLTDIVDDLLAAERLNGGPFPIVAAAQAYKANHRQIVYKSITDTRNEFLAAKEKENLSPDHLKGLRGATKKLAEDFDIPVANLTRPALEKWLLEIAPNSRTRKNYRGSLSNFFNWCKDMGYLPETWKELKMPKKKPGDDESAPPYCYAPEEMQSLLREAEKDGDAPLIVFLVLRGLVGLRNAECFRVGVSELRPEHIVVEGRQSKVRGRRRLAPLHGHSAAWLAKYAPKSGKLIQRPKGELGTGSWSEKLQAFWARCKVPRVDNALRDSFISYRMAQCRDAQRVSDEAGNSPAKVRANYQQILLADGRLVTEELAGKWFDIAPDKT